MFLQLRVLSMQSGELEFRPQLPCKKQSILDTSVALRDPKPFFRPPPVCRQAHSYTHVQTFMHTRTHATHTLKFKNFKTTVKKAVKKSFKKEN